MVIGGGVNGTAIARDAAGRGLKVVLCEMNDLASGTSSASSKLIHGGLRYLEHYEFRLVRKSLAERETLLRTAPHLVKPMRFVLPHQKGLRPRWLLRLGLYLYDMLSPRGTVLPKSGGISLEGTVEGGPLKDTITQGFVYSDCWVDDSRLVVLNAVDAAQRGAEILTRTRCTELTCDGNHWRATVTDANDNFRQITARCVVNAAGPWAGEVLGLIRPGGNASAPLRLVKGSHIVVPKLYEGEHAYLFQNPDGRIVFALPFEGRFTMIGTTEAEFSGDPSDAKASEEEVTYLCRAASDYFTKPVIPDLVHHAFAGVRPLYDDSGNAKASAVTRDYVFDLDAADSRPPVLNIYGGKLTTSRTLAEQALESLKPILGFTETPWTADSPLPGGDIPDADFDGFLARMRVRYSWLPLATLRRLTRAYGRTTPDILGDAGSVEDLGMAFGQGFSAAEVAYLQNHEWAMTPEDVLWRRSKLGLHMTPEEQQVLKDWFHYGDRTESA